MHISTSILSKVIISAVLLSMGFNSQARSDLADLRKPGMILPVPRIGAKISESQSDTRSPREKVIARAQAGLNVLSDATTAYLWDSDGGPERLLKYFGNGGLEDIMTVLKYQPGVLLSPALSDSEKRRMAQLVKIIASIRNKVYTWADGTDVPESLLAGRSAEQYLKTLNNFEVLLVNASSFVTVTNDPTMSQKERQRVTQILRTSQIDRVDAESKLTQRMEMPSLESLQKHLDEMENPKPYFQSFRDRRNRDYYRQTEGSDTGAPN